MFGNLVLKIYYISFSSLLYSLNLCDLVKFFFIMFRFIFNFFKICIKKIFLRYVVFKKLVKIKISEF